MTRSVANGSVDALKMSRGHPTQAVQLGGMLICRQLEARSSMSTRLNKLGFANVRYISRERLGAVARHVPLPYGSFLVAEGGGRIHMSMLMDVTVTPTSTLQS